MLSFKTCHHSKHVIIQKMLSFQTCYHSTHMFSFQTCYHSTHVIIPQMLSFLPNMLSFHKCYHSTNVIISNMLSFQTWMFETEKKKCDLQRFSLEYIRVTCFKCLISILKLLNLHPFSIRFSFYDDTCRFIKNSQF